MREQAPQRLAMQYARIIDDKAFDDLEGISINSSISGKIKIC